MSSARPIERKKSARSGIIRTFMQIRPGIEVASLSDVGCQRENNEDRYLYWEPDSDEEFERKGRLAMVADGMGGHEGGQEASRIAVETVAEVYGQAPDGTAQELLLAAFKAAHERILEHARQHPALHGMGTTATAIALVGDRLYYAHVGDSRLYLVRGETISRLTHDHSYVGRLVENGILSLQEAEAHPQRHILTAALGAGEEIAPDVPENSIFLESGDVILLCTDGLWGVLTEAELQDAVAGAEPSAACRSLIEMAKERGGPDNITVQVLRLS
jgi:serine/threonine protein phosphatase PrpC